MPWLTGPWHRNQLHMRYERRMAPVCRDSTGVQCMSDAPAIAPVELATDTWLYQANGDPCGNLIWAAAWCHGEFAIIIGKTAYQRLVQHLDTAPLFQQWFGSALAFPQNIPLPDMQQWPTEQTQPSLAARIIAHGRQCILGLVGILTGASDVTIGASGECPCERVIFVTHKT